MRKRGYQGEKHLFWIEFIIMSGVLLLIIAMTLLGVTKAHKLSEVIDEKIEMSFKMQNLIEYCKANKDQLNEGLEKLGGISTKDGEECANWVLFYNEDWKQVKDVEEAGFIIQMHIALEKHTHSSLENLVLDGYKIEDNPSTVHDTKQVKKTLLLKMKGAVSLKGDEAM